MDVHRGPEPSAISNQDHQMLSERSRMHIADRSCPQYPTRTIQGRVDDRGQTQSAISVQGVEYVDSPSRPGIEDQSSPRYSIRNYVQGCRPLRTRLVRNMHPNHTFKPILVAYTYSFRQNPRSFSFSLKTLPSFLKV